MSTPPPVPPEVPDPPRRPARPRRRDRHGRGPRGPLAPPGVPLSRTRSQAFDDVVLDAVEGIDNRWSVWLREVEFAVEDVPPAAALIEGGDGTDPVPLGALVPATTRTPARVVVYRRPVEARSEDAEDLADLVRDVVVEQVAALLEVSPADVDPGYGDSWDDDGP